MQRFVITGGLGVGKTTLLNEIRTRFVVAAEPARELIAEHTVGTGEASLDHRPELFVSRLVTRSVDKYESVPEAATVVFDRGIPDCVAYAMVSGVETRGAMRSAELHRYEDPVFVAAPWRDIYHTDEMRKATFEEAETFYRHVIAVYESLGYELVEIPQTSVEDRASFVLAHIDT